jgi:sensor histidine kinase YesM
VLQPLVENAIRHGIAARSSRGSLQIKAWRDNGALRLRVADDGPGLSEAPTEGVGLSNTRERLKRLYGEQGQSLALQSSPGAGVTVDVTLPFHEAHGNGSNGHR